MSRYLIDEIEHQPRIEVWPRTRGRCTSRASNTRGRGAGRATIGQTSEARRRRALRLHRRQARDRLARWPARHRRRRIPFHRARHPASQREPGEPTPLFLETSRPGIFGVGDVRSGSIKRVATAIGEGSMAVRLVFERLQVAGTQSGGGS